MWAPKTCMRLFPVAWITVVLSWKQPKRPSMVKWINFGKFIQWISMCLWLLYMRSVQKLSSHVLWKRDIYWRRYNIQETLYIGHDVSVPFKVGTWGPHTVLPVTIRCPIVYSWISLMVWNFKGDYSLGKSQNHREPNLGCRGLSHLGDLMFCQKSLHEMWCVSGCIIMTKLPITSCP